MFEAINGKTQAEWEAEWNVAGEIEHLKGLGWESYQWRFVPAEDCKTVERKDGSTRIRGCFAEFFSTFFHGYLRGDGVTVYEAVNQCLNRAQKFAACRHHEYATMKGYSNGLIACKFCGFNGHTTLVEALQRYADDLKLALSVEQGQCAERIRYVQENDGKTWEEGFEESLEQVITGMAKAVGNREPRKT